MPIERQEIADLRREVADGFHGVHKRLDATLDVIRLQGETLARHDTEIKMIQKNCGDHLDDTKTNTTGIQDSKDQINRWRGSIHIIIGILGFLQAVSLLALGAMLGGWRP
jgi:hypothetical protein